MTPDFGLFWEAQYLGKFLWAKNVKLSENRVCCTFFLAERIAQQ
jgi:hypothetical protein